MAKFWRTVGIVVAFVLFLMFVLVFGFLPEIFLLSVPDNPMLSIPSTLEPKMIVPMNLGGMDYYEVRFDKSSGNWLSLCYEALNVDDPEDVCSGFVRGYLRAYTTYALGDGTRLNDRDKYVTDNYFGNNTFYLARDHTVLLHVLEYGSPRDAKYAASFLTVDVSYPKVLIGDAWVIGLEFPASNWAHYVLPSGKFVISVQGSSRAVKGVMSNVVESYKKKPN